MHSGSSRAKIQLHRDGEKIELEVSDEGHGISGADCGPGETMPADAAVGILSMQERVKQAGGRLEIESINNGFTVRVTIPSNG